MGFMATVIGRELKLRLAPDSKTKWVLKIPPKANIHVDVCDEPDWLCAVYRQRLGYVMNEEEYLKLHREQMSYGVDGCQRYGEPDLKQGSVGKNVETLQHDLHSLQWTDLAVDGAFGPKTAEALKEFQSIRGLKQDGKAGVETKSVLYYDCFIKPRYDSGSQGHAHQA